MPWLDSQPKEKLNFFVPRHSAKREMRIDVEGNWKAVGFKLPLKSPYPYPWQVLTVTEALKPSQEDAWEHCGHLVFPWVTHPGLSNLNG